MRILNQLPETSERNADQQRPEKSCPCETEAVKLADQNIACGGRLHVRSNAAL